MGNKAQLGATLVSSPLDALRSRSPSLFSPTYLPTYLPTKQHTPGKPGKLAGRGIKAGRKNTLKRVVFMCICSPYNCCHTHMSMSWPIPAATGRLALGHWHTPVEPSWRRGAGPPWGDGYTFRGSGAHGVHSQLLLFRQLAYRPRPPPPAFSSGSKAG